MIIRNHTTNYPTQRRRVRRGFFSTRCLRPQRRAVTARGRRVFSLTVHFLSRIGICRSLRSRAVMARLCVRKTISWQKTSLRTLRLCVVFKGLVVRLRIIIKIVPKLELEIIHGELNTWHLCTSTSATVHIKHCLCAEKTQNIIDICRNINGICKNISGIFTNINDILTFVRTPIDIIVHRRQVRSAFSLLSECVVAAFGVRHRQAFTAKKRQKMSRLHEMITKFNEMISTHDVKTINFASVNT